MNLQTQANAAHDAADAAWNDLCASKGDAQMAATARWLAAKEAADIAQAAFEAEVASRG
ncbi:hypothetical protein [Variovorax sp. GT1P44]|uniref:hypothetical protein n=1 Tax=Variovorax sp. GT1P44 TaxID=3443742 RepID=UPI003F474BA5